MNILNKSGRKSATYVERVKKYNISTNSHYRAHLKYITSIQFFKEYNSNDFILWYKPKTFFNFKNYEDCVKRYNKCKVTLTRGDIKSEAKRKYSLEFNNADFIRVKPKYKFDTYETYIKEFKKYKNLHNNYTRNIIKKSALKYFPNQFNKKDFSRKPYYLSFHGYTRKTEIYEKRSNTKCKNMCKWIRKHNKLPEWKSSNLLERRYFLWLKANRKSSSYKRKKGETGAVIFYKSNLQIVKSHGYPDLFNPKKL
jgi:hypothetical protein